MNSERHSSDRQKTACRNNGAKSRGPVTEAGKARSAMNALRHGILSNNILAAAEKTENFKRLYDQHIERFGPLDGVEFGMLESMLSSYWRMHRVWAIEKTWLDQEVAALPKTNEMLQLAVGYANLSHTDKHKLVARYENRMHRMYRMSLDTLVKLQKNRPEDPAEATGPEPTGPAQLSLFPVNPGRPAPADTPPAQSAAAPESAAPLPVLPALSPAVPAQPGCQTNLIPFANTIEGKPELPQPAAYPAEPQPLARPSTLSPAPPTHPVCQTNLIPISDTIEGKPELPQPAARPVEPQSVARPSSPSYAPSAHPVCQTNLIPISNTIEGKPELPQSAAPPAEPQLLEPVTPAPVQTSAAGCIQTTQPRPRRTPPEPFIPGTKPATQHPPAHRKPLLAAAERVYSRLLGIAQDIRLYAAG